MIPHEEARKGYAMHATITASSKLVLVGRPCDGDIKANRVDDILDIKFDSCWHQSTAWDSNFCRGRSTDHIVIAIFTGVACIINAIGCVRCSTTGITNVVVFLFNKQDMGKV